MEMIMKYKAGDKVRCVDNSRYLKHLTVGKVYTVLRQDTDPRYVRIEPDHGLDEGGYRVERFELVHDAVLTPEEVFEHLRKGTELQYRRTSSLPWSSTSAGVKINDNPTYRMITLGEWRVKPEPEVIELNGKKYIEIME